MNPFREFRYPIISLVFHPDRHITEQELEKLNQYFESHPKKYDGEPDQFYFNKLYPLGEKEDKLIDQEYYTNLGLQYQTANYINYFDAVIEKPRTKVEDLKVLSGDYFDPELHQKFREATHKGFDRESDDKQDRIDIGVQKASNPKTIILETAEGLPIASGAVFQNNEYGYLFAGSVIPEYRSKGVWKKLLYERQKLSALNGVKHWVYSSSNDHIKHHSSYCFENICYSKDEV